MDLSPWVLAALCAVTFCAGAIDAIAGGGGLLTVPALLTAGLPPAMALGTNKGQSVFGATVALYRYARFGWIDRRRALVMFPAGMLGAFIGAWLLLQLDPAVLRPLVLVLLLVAAVAIAVRRPSAAPPATRASHAPMLGRAFLIALPIGIYDGFFGPGTGTFLILALVGLLQHDLARATGEAKVANFASNLAALSLFAAQGLVVWSVALPMAASQMAGGWVGTHFARRGGEKVIRWVVLAVVIALVIKLAADLVRSAYD